MTTEGLKAFSLKKDSKSGIYSYEDEHGGFDTNFENLFKENKIAWEFFSRQAPSYRKAVTNWIMSAKQESTRQARLEKTINASEQQKRLT